MNRQKKSIRIQRQAEEKAKQIDRREESKTDRYVEVQFSSELICRDITLKELKNPLETRDADK